MLVGWESGPFNQPSWMAGVESRGPYQAPAVPLSVVSCVTSQGIVRAICQFGEAVRMIREVQQAVGILNDETEWTGFNYDGLPSYVGLSAWDVPAGVYLFEWLTPGMWRDPAQRRSVRQGRLLWRPAGWVEGKKEGE